VLVGLVFIVAGLAFKMAAVPVPHVDARRLRGRPSPATAFIAGAPKVAAVGLAVRVLMEPFGGWTDQWQQVIIAISLASMFLGAFAPSARPTSSA
jgi:NADH-quinone oxidoreductase subunit N